MKDVATLAGVSVATVSLVLAGKGRISDSTRQRVRDAVEQLEYVVNPSARAMRTDRTAAVGLYLPDYAGTLDFYMALLFGVSEAARERDYSVVVVAPNQVHRGLSSFAVDGFILVDIDPDDIIARDILENPKPVIVGEAIDRSLPTPTASIEFDHTACTRRLLNHLWDSGARRIAMLGTDANQQWSISVNREYCDWSRAHAIEPILVVVDISHKPADIERLVTTILEQDPRVDAFVAVPDATAPAIANGIRLAGKCVGEDVLVASYLDGRFAEWMTPTITALDFQPRSFGRRLFDLFHEIVNETGTSATRQFVDTSQVALIIRESTKRFARRAVMERDS